MQDNDLTIVIGGEAGQGLVTIGTLLSKILVRSGYHIVVSQDYQSRIRGGHNSFAVRVVRDDAYGPAETIDLLVAMDKASVDIHRPQMNPRTVIIIDEAFGTTGDSFLAVPYRQLGEKRYENTVALGVLGALLGLKEEAIARALAEVFGKKEPAVLEANLRVLKASADWAARQSVKPLGLPDAGVPDQYLMMNGNDGIALGALAAGVRFCSFYPMTPSTSVALNLVEWGSKAGVAVEQAEDEIAAINMAIGASYAGAPAIVPTSGGGFALMTEGVSLAGMTETPVVIVIGQRPGPATGLPTRTEQGELNFVIHAGHGEFARPVFAPGDVPECFHLTRKAFETAARFQGPVFILTDQYLADSYRAVEPFDGAALRETPSGIADAPLSVPYRRYEITESGVSPRLLPGASEHLVVADSDEHTEDGHITEEMDVRTTHGGKEAEKVGRHNAGGHPSRLFRSGKAGAAARIMGIDQRGRPRSRPQAPGPGKGDGDAYLFPGLAAGARPVHRVPAGGRRGRGCREQRHGAVRGDHRPGDRVYDPETSAPIRRPAYNGGLHYRSDWRIRGEVLW